MCIFRYDVELFLRIEQLLGHKIPVYEPNKESVMVMMERVAEAQRIAKLVSTSDLRCQGKCRLTGVVFREFIPDPSSFAGLRKEKINSQEFWE